ncbi:hypothetical protein HanPSC8_Chr11g0471651 [Helianthus annuus]|nr:hypothetical protein HanPSC8_Chr11g0471651 [Helianthus annuus]
MAKDLPTLHVREMAISLRILDQCLLRNVFIATSTFPSGIQALVHAQNLKNKIWK